MTANVDLIKKFYSSFKAKDKKTYLQICDDNVEWHITDNISLGTTYLGRSAVFDTYFRDLFSCFAEFHAITEEFLDVGDVVVVIGKYQIVTKRSGQEIFIPFAHVYKIKNEKIVKFRRYTDTVRIQDAAKN